MISASAKANLKMYTIKIADNHLLVYGPGTIEPIPVPVNFNIDLNTELMAIGEYKRVMDVLVLRIASTNDVASFIALSSICTHQGSTIDYKPSQNQLVCPTHGSTFDIAGQVVRGPAALNLKKYKISIAQNILNVSEA